MRTVDKPLFFKVPSIHSVEVYEPTPETPVKDSLYLGWRIEDGRPVQTHEWALNGKWLKPLTVIQHEDYRLILFYGFAIDLDYGREKAINPGMHVKVLSAQVNRFSDLVSVSLRRSEDDHFVISESARSVILWASSARIAKSIAKALDHGMYHYDSLVTIYLQHREGRSGDYSFVEDESGFDFYRSTTYLGRIDGRDPRACVRLAEALQAASYNPLTASSKPRQIKGRWDELNDQSREWLAKVDAQIADMEKQQKLDRIAYRELRGVDSGKVIYRR